MGQSPTVKKDPGPTAGADIEKLPFPNQRSRGKALTLGEQSKRADERVSEERSLPATKSGDPSASPRTQGRRRDQIPRFPQVVVCPLYVLLENSHASAIHKTDK